MLTKDQICSRTRRVEISDIPEFGKVGILKLTMSQVDDWRKKAKEYTATNPDDSIALKLLVVYCLVDDKGTALFEPTVEAANQLAENTEWEYMSQLYELAAKANKLIRTENDTATQAKN